MLESRRLASHAQDDGFHEIQLNGKQLVFVFMATTVVLVVTFLCGVLVGRGVRGEQAETVRAIESSADDQLRSAVETEKPPTVQQAEDPTKAPPPAPAEGGGSTEATAEAAANVAAAVASASAVKDPAAAKAKPEAATTGAAKPDAPRADAAKPANTRTEPVKADTARTEPPRTASASAAAAKPEPKAEARAETAKGESAKSESARTESAKADGRENSKTAALPAASENRSGWVVQVAAVKTRGEADTIAKRLTSKGYSAFVLSNSAKVFRVRVGGYPSKRDADTVAAKLRKEERVTPWVTR